MDRETHNILLMLIEELLSVLLQIHDYSQGSSAEDYLIFTDKLQVVSSVKASVAMSVAQPEGRLGLLALVRVALVVL